MDKIRIAITDDHSLVREGIGSILESVDELTVVGNYDSGSSTLAQIKTDKPDVLFLDINLPDINGIELSKKLLRENDELKIIALSSHDDPAIVKSFIKTGAHGFMAKNTSKGEILEAIKSVLSNVPYLHPHISNKLSRMQLGISGNHAMPYQLTRREKEVLQAISEELTTKEIAEKLYISVKTVETHRMNLLSKLNAKNSVGLIKTALEFGLI